MNIEMFYLNSTLNFGIPPLLVFQLKVYYKADRLLTGLIAHQRETTARWYSNKTSLIINYTARKWYAEIQFEKNYLNLCRLYYLYQGNYICLIFWEILMRFWTWLITSLTFDILTIFFRSIHMCSWKWWVKAF